jgi:hypothetical protein
MPCFSRIAHRLAAQRCTPCVNGRLAGLSRPLLRLRTRPTEPLSRYITCGPDAESTIQHVAKDTLKVEKDSEKLRKLSEDFAKYCKISFTSRHRQLLSRHKSNLLPMKGKGASQSRSRIGLKARCGRFMESWARPGSQAPPFTSIP